MCQRGELSCSGEYCREEPCQSWEFTCSIEGNTSFSCVPLMFLCDGTEDCENGIDEIYCDGKKQGQGPYY